MENGRNTNLRSPVRPVSPLSRWQKAPLPLVDDNDDGVVDSDSERDDRRKLLSSSSGKHGNRIITRSSSRSPALFSSVHLASTGTTTVVDIPPSEETRRIIVRRSLHDPEPDDDYAEKQQPSSKHQNLKSIDEYSRSVVTSHNSNKRRTKDERSRKAIRRSMLHKYHRSIPQPIIPSGIDRENACPILLHYNKGKMPENEIQLNTWIDASLAELAEEVRSVVRVARRRGTRMHFAVVYPDSRGTYGRHQLGVEPNNDGMNNNSNNNTNSQKPFNLVDDSAVMLISKKFQIGDCVDCAIVECTPGSLGGWSSGRRPLGPPPPSQLTASDSRISALEEARMI
uniref:18 kDa Sin3-associated polypeptide n=1 Tax=Trichobilharzia regenti TaxID=157069 RepID=A0AA85K4Y6_TRIRE|nr:unnamed protein product [Trichobilharzia regenti]